MPEAADPVALAASSRSVAQMIVDRLDAASSQSGDEARQEFTHALRGARALADALAPLAEPPADDTTRAILLAATLARGTSIALEHAAANAGPVREQWIRRAFEQLRRLAFTFMELGVSDGPHH